MRASAASQNRSDARSRATSVSLGQRALMVSARESFAVRDGVSVPNRSHRP